MSQAGVPEQELEDFVFVETELGVPRWILHAKHMSDFKATDVVLAEGVNVDFFELQADSLAKTSTLVADSGKLVRPNGDLRVWGDVVVKTDEGVQLRTGWLQWSKDDELIATDDTVFVEQDGDIMRGKGLESDPELRDVRILHDVVGTVQERR
jgi:LPS export ABC transporter protein LptC